MAPEGDFTNSATIGKDKWSLIVARDLLIFTQQPSRILQISDLESSRNDQHFSSFRFSLLWTILLELNINQGRNSAPNYLLEPWRSNNPFYYSISKTVTNPLHNYISLPIASPETRNCASNSDLNYRSLAGLDLKAKSANSSTEIRQIPLAIRSMEQWFWHSKGRDKTGSR